MEAWHNNWPALTANLLVCGFGLGLACLAIWRTRRLLILPATVIAYLLTNALFTPLPLFVPVDVPFPTAPVVYERLAICNALFTAIAAVGLVSLTAQRLPSETASPALPAIVPLGLLGLGSICLAFFFLRNPEVFTLSQAMYRAPSYESYLEARNAVGDAINGKAASGNGPLMFAYSFLFPAVLAVTGIAPRLSAGLQRLTKISAWGGMVLATAVIGSRMMWLFTLIYPILLWRFGRVSGASLVARMRQSWRTLLTWSAVLLAGVLVFRATVQSEIGEAAFLLFARIFVAPGAVSGGYFMLFPDFFAFRGFEGIFMMPVAGDTVDFSMISLASTGIDSHANASFVATAYSAFGFPGVALVSGTLTLAAFAIDCYLRVLPRRLASLVLVANAFGVLMLCSVPFRVAVVTNGYLLGPVLLCALQLFARPSARAAAAHSALEARSV